MTGQFIPVGATYYHVVPDGRGVEWIAKPKDGWEFLTPMATAMRAVNAHDALVAACEAAHELLCGPINPIDRKIVASKLYAAIKLANGGASLLLNVPTTSI